MVGRGSPAGSGSGACSAVYRMWWVQNTMYCWKLGEDGQRPSLIGYRQFRSTTSQSLWYHWVCWRFQTKTTEKLESKQLVTSVTLKPACFDVFCYSCHLFRMTGPAFLLLWVVERRLPRLLHATSGAAKESAEGTDTFGGQHTEALWNQQVCWVFHLPIRFVLDKLHPHQS